MSVPYIHPLTTGWQVVVVAAQARNQRMGFWVADLRGEDLLVLDWRDVGCCVGLAEDFLVGPVVYYQSELL